jgi:hypothetical protein
VTAPETKVERRSSQSIVMVEPPLTPLVPEERIDPKAYVRWRADALETVRR